MKTIALAATMTTTFSCAFVAIALALAATASLAATDDADLKGCWRSQHVRLTFADGNQRDQNGDCVISYDGTRARSRCHNPSGDTDTVYTYESIGPGRLRTQSIDRAGKPIGEPNELRFRIDDQWLIFERQLTPPPAASAARQPQRFNSLSIRVPPGPDGQESCLPRGDSPLRVGKTSVSSLMLRLPDGWEPQLIDPAEDKALALAINRSFFIGAFKPRNDLTAPGTARLVLVLDDVRPGPTPIRAAEFSAVKQRFLGEFKTQRADPRLAAFFCDQTDRACGIVRGSDGLAVYTELFNVRGRVAMVSSTGPEDPDSIEAMRRSVRVFVQALAKGDVME